MKVGVYPEESGGLLGGKSEFTRRKPQACYNGLKKAALRLPKVLVNNIDFRRQKRASVLVYAQSFSYFTLPNSMALQVISISSK